MKGLRKFKKAEGKTNACSMYVFCVCTLCVYSVYAFCVCVLCMRSVYVFYVYAFCVCVCSHSLFSCSARTSGGVSEHPPDLSQPGNV